ncbi:hypothetical protein [Leptothermofonsia sp. ETS-13]|uniref:hypothetical protein n=1 Tax=Leptothermofonsia sp. ETS-13 TaxID=3035696 RepID=UPI003BA2D3A3
MLSLIQPTFDSTYLCNSLLIDVALIDVALLEVTLMDVLGVLIENYEAKHVP